MVDLRGVLSRVLNRIPKEHAIEIITEKTGWIPAKKPKKKDEIKERFLELADIIRENEVEDFVQMAVMKKSKGLPAYTYRLTNVNFISNRTLAELIGEYTCEEFTFRDSYIISASPFIIGDELHFEFRLKEYDSQWKTGVNNITTLSAVFTSKVVLDLTRQVLTVYNGNHQVQEIFIDFISSIFKWPISAYSLKEFPNQVNEIGSVSFKTALLLDFVNNRLSSAGITSTFKEIKFFIGNKAKKDGIRDVAIGGKALLSSQLACEYITTGSDIVSFSTDMTFNETEFSTTVYLKGPRLNILKIVITETDNENFRLQAMGIIQSEYIKMCTSGIHDLPETKKQLNTIAQKYFNKDQLINRAIQESTLKSIKTIVALLPYFNEQDDQANEGLRDFIKQNQTILDSIGFDGINLDIEILSSFVGITKEEFVDEDDYTEEIEETHESN